jgi:ubiquinone/menaquinone biosynthesis C-methylase UbiE
LNVRLHASASRGFQAAADACECGRPDYPNEVALHFAKEFRLSANSTILDLAAGTGKFTKVLIGVTNAQVVALEPVDAMRRNLASNVHGAHILAGIAETLPLAKESVNGVTVAQAFHWFDSASALKEIHRVLKPKGGLGLVWNVRDDHSPWAKKVNQLVDRYLAEQTIPRYRSGSWKKAFEDTNLFQPLKETHFQSVQRGTRRVILDRFLSISYIASLPLKKREEFARELNAILDSDPQTKGAERIDLRHRVDVYWTFRRN